MGFFSDKDVEQRENDMYEAHCIKCGSGDVSVARMVLVTTVCCNDCGHVHEIDTVYKNNKDKFFKEGGIVKDTERRNYGSQTLNANEEVEIKLVMNDSHMAYNMESREFTAPISGYYELHGVVQLNSGEVLKFKRLSTSDYIKRITYNE